MATIHRFEDLTVWQDARAFCKWVFYIIQNTNLGKDYKLRNQIDEAAGSIMDNIAEGFERGGRKEFITFLSYSKGSSGECRSQLYRIYDRGYISQDDFNEKYDDVCKISAKLNRFIAYLNDTKIDGWKFKEPLAEYGKDIDE